MVARRPGDSKFATHYGQQQTTPMQPEPKKVMSQLNERDNFDNFQDTFSGAFTSQRCDNAFKQGRSRPTGVVGQSLEGCRASLRLRSIHAGHGSLASFEHESFNLVCGSTISTKAGQADRSKKGKFRKPNPTAGKSLKTCKYGSQTLMHTETDDGRSGNTLTMPSQLLTAGGLTNVTQSTIDFAAS